MGRLQSIQYSMTNTFEILAKNKLNKSIDNLVRKHFPVLSSFTTYHRFCNYINTTGADSAAGTAYPSGAHEFTPGFKLGSCYSMFMFCRSLFVLLYFFFWPLCCLFFSDIQILITHFGIFKLFL